MRRFLHLRDVPLWLAGAGLFMMVVVGLSVGLLQPDILPAVPFVSGAWILALAFARLAVRRLPYVRIARVALAWVALVLVFELGYFGGWYLLPAAVSLILVEVFAAPPGGPTRAAPPKGHRTTSDFDWPDDPADA